MLPPLLIDAPIAVASLDLHGRILDANRALLHAAGYTLEELRGRPFEEFLDPGSAADARERFGALASGRLNGCRADHRYRNRAGEMRDIDLTVSLIRDGAGMPSTCLAVLQDVTDYKTALRNSARRAAELEAVIQSIPAAVYISDETGIKIANQPGLAQIGFRSVDEMGGAFDKVAERLQVRHAATGAPVAPEHRAFARALRGERVDMEVQVRHVATGEDRLLHVVAGPVTLEGTIVGAVATTEDITERVRELQGHRAAEAERDRLLEESRAAQRELEAASRMKDDFLAVLSHELRTPLNAVLGWARILRSRPVGEQTAHAVAVIERNAVAQARLIDDLLDLARIITGKTRLTVDEVDVSALASGALESVRPAAEAKRIDITLDIPEPLPVVTADPQRLQQVFWNLLSNAVKFTESGGRVSLLVTSDTHNITGRVTDTGIGLSPAILPKVFDRFTQGDSSSTRAHSGLGLGLAIVRHLVELHGGTVHAYSEGLGKGSTFSFSIPRR